jgi:hypothetical protein
LYTGIPDLQGTDNLLASIFLLLFFVAFVGIDQCKAKERINESTKVVQDSVVKKTSCCHWVKVTVVCCKKTRSCLSSFLGGEGGLMSK